MHRRLPRANQWGKTKANGFITWPILILSLDVGTTMWHIVIPLSMTVSSCGFDMEKKSLTYSLDILFIKLILSMFLREKSSKRME